MQRKFWNELMEWKEKNETMPLMVVGAKQIGKTYIIDKFCKENYTDYIYINLMDNEGIIEIFNENINTEEKVKKMELYLNHIITEETIIFFDEIQESEKLISSLKYFCEAKKPYKIICAGSLLGVKLKRFQSSFPVGKVMIKYMSPMTFEEFLNAIGYQRIIPELLFTDSNFIWQIYYIFSKVTPHCGQTVTKVTVCNLVGPPELSLYKKYNKFAYKNISCEL